MARQGVLVEPYRQLNKVVKLGARDENNCLILDGSEPRVHFVPVKLRPPYPFKSRDMVDETLLRAQERLEEVLSLPPHHIDKLTTDKVFQQVTGLLTRLRDY